MATAKSKKKPTTASTPASKRAPTRTGGESPTEQMGAEDESADDANKSADKAPPLKRPKH